MIEVTREWLEERKDMSAKDIAQELGCHPSHVRRVFYRYDVVWNRSRKSPHPPVSTEWLRERIEWTNKEIAAKVGCEPERVYRLFKSHGLERKGYNRRSVYQGHLNVSCECKDCDPAECMRRAMAGLPVECETGGNTPAVAEYERIIANGITA